MNKKPKKWKFDEFYQTSKDEGFFTNCDQAALVASGFMAQKPMITYLEAENKKLNELLDLADKGLSFYEEDIDWEYCGPQCDTGDKGETAKETRQKIKDRYGKKMD